MTRRDPEYWTIWEDPATVTTVEGVSYKSTWCPHPESELRDVASKVVKDTAPFTVGKEKLRDERILGSEGHTCRRGRGYFVDVWSSGQDPEVETLPS